MSKITKAAAGKSCTARIPNVCCNDPTKTSWAHIRSIRYGAGRALKPCDLIGLIACDDCHHVIDGRVRKNKKGEIMDRDFVKLCALEGHLESLMILWGEGIIE